MNFGVITSCQSFNILFVTIMGHFLFKEKITLYMFGCMLVIASGIIWVTITKHSPLKIEEGEIVIINIQEETFNKLMAIGLTLINALF